MKSSKYRPSKIVVDLEAIRYNVKEEIKRLPKETDLFAVVKADGYGHGALEVAKAALEVGAKGLCVSNLDEAVELREAGITQPILVLSYVSLEFLEVAVANNITLTATSLEWIKQLNDRLDKKITIHLKIDSGMGRVGIIDLEEMREAKTILQTNPYIDFEGIFTHFSKADSQDDSYLNLQKERFSSVLKVFGETVKYIHTANSATALWHDAWESNLVRFGDAMYGMNPSGKELKTPYSLKQALTLETEIIHIKQLAKGEKIGYGATYETESKEWIATLPIGYADGFRRDFQGFEVLVEGQKVPVVGRVCMDQCMIKLSSKLPVGTKVIIFGDSQEQFNSIQTGAEYIQTINYEITCGLTERLPRYYVNK